MRGGRHGSGKINRHFNFAAVHGMLFILCRKYIADIRLIVRLVKYFRWR